MTKIGLLAFVAAGALAGCGGGADNNAGAASGAAVEAPAAADDTVGSLASADPALGKLGRIVTGAGMADLLNGVGPYTLFAPTDAALNGLGDGRADALAGADLRAQAVALLRAHLVPGTITRADIEAGLSAQSGTVRVRTLGDTVLTFARDGDGIAITSDRGGRARLTGEQKVASNGAVQPIDGVLLAAQ